jgi:chorismate-pyruvate lyase
VRIWPAFHICSAALLALCVAIPPQAAAPAPAWRDTTTSRLASLALIQTLNAELLASNSATLTLQQWCAEHHLAEKPEIVAHRIDPDSQAPSATPREHLQVSAHELVRYRRVELSCGEHVLSVAENWYVPGRLTQEMNRLLATTQTPFGIVVRALSPHRETIAVNMLWSPLPPGWDSSAAALTVHSDPDARLQMPAALFEHRAILYSAQHRPIAELHELYQRDLLAFPEPRLP